MQTTHDLTPTRVALAQLIHHPENARTHDLATLKISLNAHGQFNPVVRQRTTGYVIKGNGTMDAAAELGWGFLDVITLDVDDDQARRILLIDNRASDNGGYDEDSLTSLLQALGDDLSGTGYDDGDLDARLAQLAITDTQGRSAVDEREGWDAKDARTILLTFTVADHQLLCGKLDQLADQMGVDTYSAVVRRLIEDAVDGAQ